MSMSPRLLRPRQTLHAETLSWQSRVIANGSSVSGSTLSAVNKFVKAVHSSGVRPLLYRCNLVCGTGINAALVPLFRGPSASGTQYGSTTDGNNGPFASGAYVEATGLDGDGVSNYLNTGLSPDGMGVPSTVHLAVFKGAGTWTTTREFIGTRDADDFYQMQMRYPASATPSVSILLGGIAGSISEVAISTSASFLLATRTSSSGLFLFQNGTKIATGSTSATTPGACSHPYMVFTRNATGTAASSPWEHAIRGYSIGLGMTDAQAAAYNTAMQEFQSALGRST